MKFYTLIHICESEKSLHNNNFVRNFQDQINLYWSCAKKLHHSLKLSGFELIVITNDKQHLQSLTRDDYALEIVQIPFVFEVPSGVTFYSSHFKIDVYKYLSTLDEHYVALIDCDIICVNKMPESFKNIIGYQVPLYYDITDQVTPAYGWENITRTKQKVIQAKSIGLWAGGEFLAGSPGFFNKLYSEVNNIKEEYFKNCESMHHQSDEVLISVAIEKMIIIDGFPILDAGTFNIIGRYWSPKTLHVQKSLEAYTNHFLLHIPSDKKFITQLKDDELQGKSFFDNYKQHFFKARILENTFKGIKPYVKKLRKKLAL